MKHSIELFCKTLSMLKTTRKDVYDKLHFYFIGTSYTPNGLGAESVLPIAKQFDVEDCITEKTDRIGYFDSINLLQKADVLLVLGSDDTSYNPSKIFTYIHTEKEIIGLFKKPVIASDMIGNFSPGIIVYFGSSEIADENSALLLNYLISGHKTKLRIDLKEQLKYYNSEFLTKEQCTLFNAAI